MDGPSTSATVHLSGLPSKESDTTGPLPCRSVRRPRVSAGRSHRGGGRCQATQRRVEVLAASRERRVVGCGQIKVQHPEHRLQKAFGLAQRKVKDKPERQRGFDRHVGVLPLPGTLADASGLPFGDRVRRQPEGHVASLNQRSIVVRPVADTVLLLVLRMHSRLHSETMRRRPSRWRGRDEHPFPRTNAVARLQSDSGNAKTKRLFPALGRISGVRRMNPDAVAALPVLTATYWRPSTA